MKDKVKDALTKIRQFKEMEKLSKDRFNYLIANDTIRQEFIKCGIDFFIYAL